METRVDEIAERIGHLEADECGAMNLFLAGASAASTPRTFPTAGTPCLRHRAADTAQRRKEDDALRARL
jgi:DNA-binding ferritin-like protein